MDRAHIGWLSGIIDGEGNFTIRILFHQTKTLGKRARFQPQLVIVNTRKTLIDKVTQIYDLIGIKYRRYVKERNLKHPNWKKVYCVIIYATALRTLISLVKPYCDKQEEIELLETFLKKEKRKNAGNIYSNEELQEMEILRLKLVDLHGETARKLSTRIANECLLSDEEIQNHTQRRLGICRKMKEMRLKNKQVG